MSTEFEMTEADLATLLAEMQPVPMIMLQCGTPRSLQERANQAWADLGEKMGFDSMTVRPNGRGDRFFSAEALPRRPLDLPDSLREQPDMLTTLRKMQGD